MMNQISTVSLKMLKSFWICLKSRGRPRHESLFSVFITHTPDRMKMPGAAAVFFKILPEIENKVVDGSCGGINIITPNGLKNLFACNDLILVFNKQFQQHGFLLA